MTPFEQDMLSLYLWTDRRAKNGPLTKDQVKYILREFKRAVEEQFTNEIDMHKEEVK
ncbi:hypothetical protein BI001_gp059 [Bacillus phage Zuko]|uniref:hypothetical protein n=2 Tax=unclassified Wphvirus TaxID=2175867 RepID=UPI0007A76FF7|nr:hypothetical protein BI001_gp059 [Bacillus phage Zuko]AMW62401.1 hypothetical protein ZUKO_59 [Bacillus phage Zuko]AOZ61681.1 hypothetical protein BJ4_58 [Bacillus phage BJ4]AXF42055.1 hypothetical protein [Bacillus phage Saddex]UGO46599.1 hypothetical protein ABINADI_282 [Bacillus phage vB_BanH_Abinadi]